MYTVEREYVHVLFSCSLHVAQLQLKHATKTLLFCFRLKNTLPIYKCTPHTHSIATVVHLISRNQRERKKANRKTLTLIPD